MRLAQYEIRERIGQGGMGVVYRARDTHLGRVVAIKVLPPLVSSDPERRSRFLREAQAAANLNHPNIATVYQFGPAEVTDPEFTGSTAGDVTPREVLFLAMEYVEGEDLYTKLTDGPLEVRTAVRYAIQIAEGLEAAHRAGVIHRDLKPNNIRITHDGRVKLLDFGLAKVREGSLSPTSQSVAGISLQTTKGMLMGTPPYMAPEMLKGEEIDHRSDLFSLGVVLYQTLAGEPPFPAGNLLDYIKALNQSEIEDLQSIRPEVPDALDGIVQNLLEQEPQHRIPSAGEVAQALRAQGGSGPVTPPTLWRYVSRSKIHIKRRKRLLPILAALVLIATACWFVAVKYLGSSSEPLTSLTLAVIPFENQTGDSEFDQITRTQLPFLISELSQVPKIRLLVPSRQDTSTRGSDGLIKGYLQQTGSGLRTILSMEEARKGLIIWSQSYEGDSKQIYSQQSSMARDLKYLIQVWIQSGKSKPIEFDDLVAKGMESLGEPNFAPDPSGATAFFDLAIRKQPNSAEAFAGRSFARQELYLRGESSQLLDQAEEDAFEAIRIAPEQAAPHIALGRLHRLRGKTTEAITKLEDALVLDPLSDHAALELALACQEAGQLDAAVAALTKALEIRPHHWDYLNQLGVVLWTQGDRESARSKFEEAAANAPENTVWPTGNLLVMNVEEGKFQEALQLASNLPTPTLDAEHAANTGTAHYFLGHFEEAASYYRRAVSLNPNNPDLFGNLGDALGNLGDRDEANKAYLSAVRFLRERIEKNPTPTYRARLQLYLAKAGQCEEVKSASKEFLIDQNLKALSTFDLAKASALCLDKRTSLIFIEKSKQLGIPIELIANSEELKSLATEESFLALTKEIHQTNEL